METKQSSPSVTDAALRMPSEFPTLPEGVVERFPEMKGWMDDVSRFWNQNQNAVNEFARSMMDVTNVAGVLLVDPNAGSLYVKAARGAGAWKDPDTPFFVNQLGQFSLGSKLSWDPVAAVLAVTGTITATAGEIGGWTIGSTTISKNNAVLDSTGQIALGTGNDVIILSATDANYRIWVGNATAAAAAFSVTKAGVLNATGANITGSFTATTGSIGGFDIGSDYIRDAMNSFGLASTVTGGNDVRFWAGATFANRATAPLRFFEDGTGTIGGFTIGATALTAGSGIGAVDLSAAGSITFGTAASTNSIAVSGSGLYIKNTAGTVVGSFLVTGSGGFLSVFDSTQAVVIDLKGSTGELIFTNDTNLYRSAANTLKTDDSLIITGTLQLGNGYQAAAMAPTGYVTVKDSAGATYKLACQA